MIQKHTLFLITFFAITIFNCKSMKRPQVKDNACDHSYPDAYTATNREIYTKEFKDALNTHISCKQKQQLLTDNDISNYRESQIRFLEKQIQEIIKHQNST